MHLRWLSTLALLPGDFAMVQLALRVMGKYGGKTTRHTQRTSVAMPRSVASNCGKSSMSAWSESACLKAQDADITQVGPVQRAAR